MKHLVIGMGQVGSGVYTTLAKKYDVQTLDINDENIVTPIDVIHVCIPYSNDFIDIVKGYQDQFQPKLTIIYSTVPIGITRELGLHTVHSPIEGRHPNLARSVKLFTRWIGYNNVSAGELAEEIWEPITQCRLVPDSNFTEFLKLSSTTEYGVNLAYADYKRKVTELLGMPYELTMDWNEDYNALYKKLLPGKGIQKYVLTSPKGKIGGHCVVPNAKLLNEQFPDEMLYKVIEMEIK